MADQELWMVGQIKGGEFPNTIWDFQGIFSSQQLAIAACRNSSYFIVPVEADIELPETTIKMPNTYFPIRRDTNG